MKKIYPTLALLFTVFCLQAQIVNIPDANFKAKLLAANSGNGIASTQTPVYNATYNTWSVSSYHTIDTNGDGEIQVSEAQQIKWLNVNCNSCGNSNKITSLTGIESFTNLQYLDCGLNQLTSLNVLGQINLQVLNCSANQLTSLNVSGLTNLQTLYCSNNQLTSLNVSGLTNLQLLFCNSNQLPSLNVSGLTNLQLLYCNSNQLPSLNVSGLTNLKYLNCGANQLPSLNVSGLTNLYELFCNSNQLTSLNVSGLTNLQRLDYSYNNIQLSNLDSSIINNLTKLGCSGTNLIPSEVLTIQSLTNLQTLGCSYNQLPSLDVSALTNLYYLDCEYNQLTYLNIKNGKNEYLDFPGNPNLQYICADEEQLTDVQNLITQYGYTNCHVNTYCSFTPGGAVYIIQGENKFDNESNGCDDADLSFPNLKYNISNGSVSGTYIANGSGNYAIPVSAGTHIVTPVFENPSYFTITPASFSVTFPAATSPYTQNFCITPNGVHNDLEVSLIPLNVARPGFNANYKIVYKNKGNTQLSGSVLFNFDDCHQITDFVTATPMPDVTTYNILTFNYTNLLPFESRSILVTLNVNSPMETPAVNIGDFLSINAHITPTQNDEFLPDNTANIRQTVVGSYDPNDKTCVEGTTITPQMVGKYLHYVIRFENTGTYPAQNVVVKDMIDTTKFDVSTLQITATSHNCTTRITNPNKVEFIFEGINLPFDDANNDGYVAFKIKSKSTVALNDVLKNKADIYFDYNFPITTNETQTTVQVLANEQFSLQNINIYPNPASEIVTINIPNEIPLKAEVFDVNGRLLQSSTLENNQLNISQLKTGNYFVKVYTESKTGVVKMIKE